MSLPRYVKSQEEVATLVGLVRGTLARLWRDGKIPEKGPNGYDVHEIARGIIVNARNVRSLSPRLQAFAATQNDLVLDNVLSAKERLEIAKADHAELMLEKARGNLVPRRDVDEFAAMVGATEQVDFLRWSSRAGPMLAKMPPTEIPIAMERLGREYLEMRANHFAALDRFEEVEEDAFDEEVDEEVAEEPVPAHGRRIETIDA